VPTARLYNDPVELLPIQTPILRPGDDLAAILLKYGTIQSDDIVAVSSKAVATVEGRRIDYKNIRPTPEAHAWAARCGGSPEFRQAILEETARMNGTILPGCPQAMLTELKPGGFPEGVLLAANAGLDESNVQSGCCIGWPIDPVRSVQLLHKQLHTAVLLTDSTCRPRRLGVTALALTVSGFDPLRSLIGMKDLFGKDLRLTQEAVADQLATAANMLMGNAGESVPAMIIRNHGIPFSNFEGWVPGIAPKDDLFGML